MSRDPKQIHPQMLSEQIHEDIFLFNFGLNKTLTLYYSGRPVS